MFARHHPTDLPMTSPIPTPDFQQQLAQGHAAAAAGDLLTARHLFRQAIEASPYAIDAWLGLAAATSVLSERHDYIRHALTLDPGHAEAQTALQAVERLLADGLLIDRRRKTRPEPEHLPPAAPAPRLRPAAAPPAENPLRLLAAGLVTTFLSLVGTALLAPVMTGFLGFCIAIGVGPIAGTLLVRLVDRITLRQRGSVVQLTIGSALLLGAMVVLLFGSLALVGLGFPNAPAAIAAMQQTAAGAANTLSGEPDPALALLLGAAVGAAVFQLKK